jgi:DnaJ-class molecular chaperone
MPKTEVECPRCNGKGVLRAYGHIRDGICFNCGGTGKVMMSNRKSTKTQHQLDTEARYKRDREEAARINHEHQLRAKEYYKDDRRIPAGLTEEARMEWYEKLARRDYKWDDI